MCFFFLSSGNDPVLFIKLFCSKSSWLYSPCIWKACVTMHRMYSLKVVYNVTNFSFFSVSSFFAPWINWWLLLMSSSIGELPEYLYNTSKEALGAQLCVKTRVEKSKVTLSSGNNRKPLFIWLLLMANLPFYWLVLKIVIVIGLSAFCLPNSVVQSQMPL